MLCNAVLISGSLPRLAGKLSEVCCLRDSSHRGPSSKLFAERVWQAEPKVSVEKLEKLVSTDLWGCDVCCAGRERKVLVPWPVQSELWRCGMARRKYPKNPHLFRNGKKHWKLRTVPKVLLRCPETLFISHENANFLFSVFRVVQGEAKTPKIMGCCRANFAFLHALKIGTFRGKWTSEWVFKTSHFFRLALYFLINSKLAFFFSMLLNDA